MTIMEIFGDFYMWIVIVLLLSVAYWYTTIPSNLPPGPLGLPVIGSLPHIGKLAYVTFVEMGKKYGNIFHLYLGSALVVVLNDHETIKEAFVKQSESFSGRNDDPSFKETNAHQNLGILFTDGNHWKQHRRFLVSNLKNNGVGKLTLEPPLLDEIDHFLAEMKRHSGKPFDVKHLLPCSLANIIILLITGQRYEYDHPMMKNIISILHFLVDVNKSVNIEMIFPWSRRIPGIRMVSNTKLKQLGKRKILSYVKDMIAKMEVHKGKGGESYVQAYTNERNSRLEKMAADDLFSEEGLIQITGDLFAAGTETTATTLMWIMMFLTFHPEVQSKVQEEIDRVIGRDRQPSYNDRQLTPYVEATILEGLRLSSIVPLSLPHRCTRDTTLQGYRIPKDTMILPNIYAVHTDPKLWGDPDNFRPDRFIGDDGKLVKTENVIPFSIGKRTCAGEPLAKMELYLYFTSLMQHFKFVRAKGVEQNMDGMHAIIRKPCCTTVCAVER